MGQPGPWSNTRSFTTLPLPAKPELRSPENNETEVVLNPTLKWGRVDYVRYYHAQVSKNDEFTDIAYENNQLALFRITVSPNLEPLTEYHWRVAAYNNGGYGQWSDVWTFTTKYEDVSVNASNESDVYLFNCIPNPFSEKTLIKIYNPVESNVKLSIYNSLGNEIETLVSGYLSEGTYEFEWKPENIESGVFYYKLNVNNSVMTNKAVFIK